MLLLFPKASNIMRASATIMQFVIEINTQSQQKVQMIKKNMPNL